MSGKRDLLVRIDSKFEDKGFKSAEASAKAMAKELDRVEAEQRRMAQAEFAAYREAESRRAKQVASIEKVGKAMMTVGAVTAVGLGIATKAAIDWESAWAGVRKTVDGSDEEMAALEQELRALAGVLPVTHEEIAGVAEAAGQLGIKRKDVASFTKTMIDLGVATNLTSNDAATALARMANIMGTLPKDISRMGATIVDLGNNSATTEREIVELGLRLAAAGRQAGLSEAQVFSFAATLTSVGVEAEAGGTAMSKVFTAISDAVKNGGDKLRIFAQVSGMTSEQFVQAYQKDAAGAITSFVEGLGRMSSSGKSTTAVFKDLKLTDERLKRALLSTGSAGDLLRRTLELGNTAWKENTALVEEANKRYQTTESRLAIARNQLNDAAIDIGANLLPALAGAADRVGALAEMFHGLPDSVKTAVTVLGVVVATVGLVGGAALLAIPKLQQMNATLAATGPAGAKAAGALSGFGRALMGPWGLAIGAATMVLGVWAEKHYQAKQRVDALAQSLEGSTGAITEETRALVVNQLEKDGALKAAQKMGIALDDVTDAAMGNEAAQERVNAAIARYRDENEQTLVVDGKVVENAYGKAQAQDRLNQETQRLTSAITGQNEEINKAVDQNERHKEAMGESGDEAAEAAPKMGEFAEGIEYVGDTAEDAKKEIDALDKAIKTLLDATFAVDEANDAWQSGLNNLSKAVKENGTKLKGNTDEAIANREALRGQIREGGNAISAMIRAGATTDELKARTKQLKDEFIKQATQLGYNKAEVNRLASAFDDIEGTYDAVVDAKTEDAMDKLSEVSRKLAALNGTTAKVAVDFRASGNKKLVRDVDLANADGRLMVESYANGGVRLPRSAVFAKDGANLVQWAERGTGGEAFIPLAESKRDKSIPLWWETGRRLGAFEAAAAAPSTPQGPVTARLDPRVEAALLRLADRDIVLDGRAINDSVSRRSTFGRRPS